MQCNFCKRIYDSPTKPAGRDHGHPLAAAAFDYLERVLAKEPRISVVGIAGPGDPFATPSLTLETLQLVREAYPEMLLCVASNGLGLPPHAESLGKLAVSHVTLTVNAVDPQVAPRSTPGSATARRSIAGCRRPSCSGAASRKRSACSSNTTWSSRSTRSSSPG